MISKRLAPRNNLMRKKYDIWTVLSVLVFVLFIIFLAFPLISLLKEAFFQKGEFTLKYFVTFFSKKYYSSTLINSFKVTIAATCLTLAIGIPLAAGVLAGYGVIVSPALGAVIMSLSTVIVAVNARLLRI